MTQADKPQGTGFARQASIDEGAVAEFLANNEDFFARHPNLLAELDLRHPIDGAVSLVDRQVQLLRTRNSDLRRHLNEILANASDNDGTFAKTRTFTLALMDTASPASLDETLAKHLVAGFDADHAICFVRGWDATKGDGLGTAIFRHLAGVGEDDAPPITRLFDRDDPSCSACRAEDYAQLFRVDVLEGPCSIALIPMRAARGGDAPDLNATLAIGARDPQRFAPDMGKVFLFYIGDVLARTLTRLGIG